MNIEMDDMLAETILQVQDVCNKNGLDLTDISCGIVWEALVEMALSKANEDFHPKFNIKGCQSSRICGTGEPNIKAI